MITVAKLRRKPRHFQSFTGVSVSEFDQLLQAFTPVYLAAEQSCHERPGRLRTPGAGRAFTLDLPERLLMALMYLRLYVSYSLLAYLFDLSESNISREFTQRLMPVLLDLLPVPLRDAPLGTVKDAAGKPSKRIGTLSELLAAHPEFEDILLDATEQSVRQPQDKLTRKQRFSGKQHDHTVKTQIVAAKSLILHVLGGLPGSLHDYTVLRGCGVLRKVPPNVRVRLDKGYEGADRAYPAVLVQQPIKKPRGKTVTALGRAYNFALSVLRIPVEHHFARLKQFRSMSQLWRGRFASHENTFCVIAGLLNFKASGKFTLA